MRLTLLLVAVLVVPGLWGAVVYWALIRIWPPGRPTAWAESWSDATAAIDLVDYQI